MNASGLIVEYNPFHFGHLHHIQEARKVSGTDCIIAVMSGAFLQRGEPAVIDKFHRTKAALASGADIVIELPYAYAVESSSLFAAGAVKSLFHMGVDSICFGSESGNIDEFLQAYTAVTSNQSDYEKVLHDHLDQGLSFPAASQKAYHAIGLAQIDLMKPNNILGFSYVRAIREIGLNIEPLTIKRIKNNYHETEIKQPIASATSIRKEIMANGFSDKMASTIPEASLMQLEEYQQKTGLVHNWELYFPLLRYQVLSKTQEELATIHGIDEGLEYRLKQTAEQACSIQHWLQLMKTKRYTQTRLQRCFVHLLTNTSKQEVSSFIEQEPLPYIRLLGMTPTGRSYLNGQKKNMDIPIFSNLNKDNASALQLDERVQQIYYTPLPIKQQQLLRRQEFRLPIMTG